MKCSTLIEVDTTYISNFWKLTKLDDLLSRISDERIKLQCALDVSYKLTEDQDYIIKKKDKLLDILHFQITLLNNKVNQLLVRMKEMKEMKKVLLTQRRKELNKFFEVKYVLMNNSKLFLFEK